MKNFLSYGFYSMYFTFLLTGCNDSASLNQQMSSITIDIQPFDDTEKKQVDDIYAEVKKVYQKVELKKSIPLPAFAYYKPRNRYRADSLIGYLNKRTPNGHVTIALTNKDISWTKGAIKDYGIMGLGLCPGNSCVASTYRLSKTNTLDQFYKIAIHELGHTQGLTHCAGKTCLMRDAEGKNHTNELKGFCDNCKQQLKNKGWALL